MDSVLFHNGTSIKASELNELQERKAESIKQRFVNTRSYGVVETASPKQIVYTDGVALGLFGITAYDQNGERIYVKDSGQTNIPVLTNLLPETLETGKDWVLVQGGVALPAQQEYTLVIRYKEVQAAPITHHVVTKQPLLTNINSTYELILRLPNNIHDGDIPLATVTTSDTGYVSVDESVRAVSTISATDVVGSITTPNTVDGVNVGNISFSDHINSLGSGTLSSKNPHALSAADLGIDIAAMGNHQKLLHSAGVRSDNLASTSSALYPYYKGESASDEEMVYIQPLSQAYNEVCVVNGISILPTDIPTTYSFSFANLGLDSATGYYLFVLNGNTKAIEHYGPFVSEEDDTFKQLLNTETIFPICSLNWQKISYDVTFDDVDDLYSYGIVPASFKDRRVFNNTSLSNFRPDESFALSQFAPIANDVAYLHNVRLTGAKTSAFYSVADKSMQLEIDGDTSNLVTITFRGANPIPVSSVINQMINALVAVDENGNTYLRAYPRITETGAISLSAPIGLKIYALTNDASTLLGFSSVNNNIAASSDGLIKEMVYYGERNGIIVFKYNDNQDVTEIDYYLGGGVVKKNLFVYKGEYITHVNEIIEKL